MKRVISILIAMILAGMVLGQEVDTVFKKQFATISNDGRIIGGKFLETDSIHEKAILFSNLDLPLIEKTVHQSYSWTNQPRVTLKEIRDAFYKNPDIDIWGLCDEPQVPEYAEVSDTTSYGIIYLRLEWMPHNEYLLLKASYHFGRNCDHWDFPITLFRKYKWSGEAEKDFIITGYYDGKFQLSENGTQALIYAGHGGISTSWAFCEPHGYALVDFKAQAAQPINRLVNQNQLAENALIGRNFSDVAMKGNSIVKTFIPYNSLETDVKYFKVIDIERGTSYMFKVPKKQANNIQYHSDGVSYLNPAGKRIKHIYSSTFFSKTH
ncbi:MAG: hypothetical protein AB8F95_02395 [Bacteroidia bacterium]